MNSKPHKKISVAAPRGRRVFNELQTLVTEKTNPRSRHIDRLQIPGILRLINEEDATVARAVRKELPYIARAVEMAVDTFNDGGHLFYIGAGTSGRLGVLDAAECPPTFGTDPRMIRGVIAGGFRSLIRSHEGVEDNIEAARNDISKQGIRSGDMVVGITASKRTPYVLEGLREAKRRGAKTVFLCCNPRKIAPKAFDLAICPVVGPEIIAGSSRMKAGTAQKMILNMITTAAMIRLGKVYGNRMVDLKATSEKLKERSKKVLVDVCGLSYHAAERLLENAGGNVKTAIVMAFTGTSRTRAGLLLKQAGGMVYRAVPPAKSGVPGSKSRRKASQKI